MNRYGKRYRSNQPSKPQCKKRLYNKYSSMVNKDKASNKNNQGGNRGRSTFGRSRCTTCGKQLLGKCHYGTYGCFVCGTRYIR